MSAWFATLHGAVALNMVGVGDDVLWVRVLLLGLCPFWVMKKLTELVWMTAAASVRGVVYHVLMLVCDCVIERV